MAKDIFGDLRDWFRVIDLLEELKEQRQLDEHQAGLARILRFRQNWRLLEHVLLHTTEISQASDVLIAEALHVLVAPDIHLEARILAARALGHLIPRRPEQDSGLYDHGRVVQTMADLAHGYGPPLLQDAVLDALAALGVARSGGTWRGAND